MNISSDLPTELTTRLVRWFFFFKTLPSLVAGVAIYLGYRLFILGVTGEASLVVDSSSVQGQLVNAAPGLFFAVGGIAALIVVVVKGLDVSISAAPEPQLELPATIGGGGGGSLGRRFVLRDKIR